MVDHHPLVQPGVMLVRLHLPHPLLQAHRVAPRHLLRLQAPVVLLIVTSSHHLQLYEDVRH